MIPIHKIEHREDLVGGAVAVASSFAVVPYAEGSQLASQLRLHYSDSHLQTYIEKTAAHAFLQESVKASFPQRMG